MNKLRHVMKAAVIIGIALAFIMPGAAIFDENQNINLEKRILYPTNSAKEKVTLGRGWEEQASGFWEVSRGINYIHAVDENIVWASGYDGSGAQQPVQEFTKTVNGGELWEADVISTAPEDGDLAMIFALDENTAWVPIHSGDPQGIWKTSDGGDTWVRQATADYSGDGAFPNIVHFWDENNGWCQGDPVDGYYEMYTTTNGGDTWTRVPEVNIPPPSGVGEYGVVGYYDVIGDTVWWGTQWNGGDGRVYKSTDRGYNWEVYETPFTSGCYIDVRMRDADNGIAMDKRSGGSLLAETSDGGETWTLIDTVGYYDYDISYLPGTDNMWVSTGAASGDSGASYSTDGCQTWTDFGDIAGTQLLDCDFIEGMIGWAGSFNDDEETGGVYKYAPSGDADLICEGSLSWVDVKPGDEVEGTFTVKNIGGASTNLDWEVIDDPSWGDWAFDPESGEDLTPEDGAVTVTVTCTAPEDKNQEFSGKIKVVNSENSEDFCYIDVSLTTPMSKQFSMLQVLQNILQHFPVLEKILIFVSFIV